MLLADVNPRYVRTLQLALDRGISLKRAAEETGENYFGVVREAKRIGFDNIVAEQANQKAAAEAVARAESAAKGPIAATKDSLEMGLTDAIRKGAPPKEIQGYLVAIEHCGKMMAGQPSEARVSVRGPLETDLDRYLTGNLPPFDPEVDPRRLTVPQAEAMRWLLRKACGVSEAFVQPGVLGPTDAGAAEPPIPEITETHHGDH